MYIEEVINSQWVEMLRVRETLLVEEIYLIFSRASLSVCGETVRDPSC